MSAFTSLKNLAKIDNIKTTTSRFGLPLAIATLMAAALIAQIFNIIPVNETVSQYILALNSAYFAAIALKLYSESYQWQNNKYLLWSLGLSILVASVTIIESVNSASFFTAGISLLITVAPFLKKDADETTYCNFNSILLRNILFFNVILALVVAVAIFSVLFSVSYLFEIKIGYRIYATIAAIYFSILSPFYILSNIPKDCTSNEQTQFAKSIRFITLYILFPLTLVYLVILYAYIGKIALAGELPKNQLSYIILAFSLVGIFTHFFSRSLYENGSNLLKSFHRYFYYLLLVPIILLFTAIKMRIEQYGITLHRYAALIIAIWLAATSIYVILTKAKNLRSLIISVSALLMLASFGPESFGPLGVNAISGASQAKQLETLLIKENILQNGKITKSGQNISPEVQNRIVNIVRYLEKTKQTNRIKGWFAEESLIHKSDYSSRNNVEILADFITITVVH